MQHSHFILFKIRRLSFTYKAFLVLRITFWRNALLCIIITVAVAVHLFEICLLQTDPTN